MGEVLGLGRGLEGGERLLEEGFVFLLGRWEGFQREGQSERLDSEKKGKNRKTPMKRREKGTDSLSPLMNPPGHLSLTISSIQREGEDL